LCDSLKLDRLGWKTWVWTRSTARSGWARAGLEFLGLQASRPEDWLTWDWKPWLSGHLNLRCLYWAPDNFPDKSPAFPDFLEVNAIEKCSW